MRGIISPSHRSVLVSIGFQVNDQYPRYQSLKIQIILFLGSGTQGNDQLHLFGLCNLQPAIRDFFIVRITFYNDKLPKTLSTKHYTALQG